MSRFKSIACGNGDHDDCDWPKCQCLCHADDDDVDPYEEY